MDDDIIINIGDVTEPVIEALKGWGEDIVDHVKEHAPQYIRYAAYALRHLHL